MAGLFFLLREGKGREFESSTAYQYYILHLHLSCLLEKSKKRLGMTYIKQNKFALLEIENISLNFHSFSR